MRNLREKLNAMATRPREANPKPAAVCDLWRRDLVVPYDGLSGVDRSALEEVRAFDPAFCGARWDPMKLLFLDTETTGLSGGAGTMVFLLGLAWLETDGLHVQQLMIRSYPQEREMLSVFRDKVSDHDTLVTFNGKSFDIPLLDSRLVLNGIRMETARLPHLDLLHACRRVYRMRLGKCTLRVVEEAILEKHRENDLPGSEAPQRFFSYLKTGHFEPLLEVARHNLEDVISLAQLTGHLCGVFRDPESLLYPEDRFSLAKTLERTGNPESAAEVYRQLSGSKLSVPAYGRLAGIERRSGHPDAAAQAWQAMIRQGSCGTEPYLSLAKYYEHNLRDYDRAVQYASGALNLALDRGIIGSAETETELREIRKRIERLRRKQFQTMNKGGTGWAGLLTESV